MQNFKFTKKEIEPGWQKVLKEEFDCLYFRDLMQFVEEESKEHSVYPPFNQIFSAFNKTPFDKTKVVIIGQDPYHGPGQAHGLSFSVFEGIKLPPSLVNIFKEIKNDLGLSVPSKGDLTPWAEQGVLLLNATLTVKAHNAGSHQKKGWETFTDAVIRIISEKRTGVVFLLWGTYAQSKQKLIDTSKHFVLKATHPSPLSAYRGFFGCGHFSKTNEILKKLGLKEIDWSLNTNKAQ
ncbi:MAG: uracil-DNA glycosylase [Bacteroidetes bacterium]|nr:uracil-DNA glycosylase [Bacteroidota bacterium]HET6245831.1 uracil-DNA glycosylase [Bacteroidia bacterium]